MIESFVDLTYRGLSLGRRIKLSQVRPSTGYLETPAPMPVGTAILIATDDGVTLEATVTSVHEQTGGSDKPPGMTVKPKLAGEVTESWWRARVAYPEEAAAPAVARTSSNTSPITVRPRSHTVPNMAAATPEPEPVGDKTQAMPVLVLPEPEPEPGGATTIMPAVDQELLESLTRKSGEIEALTRTTGEHEVVDDGKQTTIMEAIDPAALGLDLGGSPGDDDNGNGNGNGNGDDKKPSGGGAVKKRRKRR